LFVGVSFEGITNGVTLVSRVKLSLPKFWAVCINDEDAVQFFARVELEVEIVVGGYSRQEHDAYVASLPNGGQLNRVFELAGVTYEPRPVPGTEAYTETLRKRKLDAYGKTSTKRVKVPGKMKIEPLNIVVPWAKSSTKQPSDAEIALAKPVKRTKKIALGSSTAPAMAWVVAGASGAKALTAGTKRFATPVWGRRIPLARMLAEASSVESQESPPHDSLPKAASKAAGDASLQLATTANISGALASHAVATASAGW
jgi:hypothetical protein